MAEEGQQLIQLELNGENVLVAVDKDGTAQTVDESSLSAGDMVLQTMIENVQPAEAEILPQAEMEMEIEEQTEKPVTVISDEKSEVIEAAERVASLPSDDQDERALNKIEPGQTNPETDPELDQTNPEIYPETGQLLPETGQSNPETYPDSRAKMDSIVTKSRKRERSLSEESGDSPQVKIVAPWKSSTQQMSSESSVTNSGESWVEEKKLRMENLNLLVDDNELSDTSQPGTDSGLVISSVTSMWSGNSEPTEPISPSSGNEKEPFLMIQNVCSLAPEKSDPEKSDPEKSDPGPVVMDTTTSVDSSAGDVPLAVVERATLDDSDYKSSVTAILPDDENQRSSSKHAGPPVSSLVLNIVISDAEEIAPEADEIAGVMKKVNVTLGSVNGRVTMYYCNYCSYNSTNRNVFLSHVVRHLFVCRTCPYQSFSRVKLLNHFNEKHVSSKITDYAVLALSPLAEKNADDVLKGGQPGLIVESCGHGYRYFCLHCPYRCCSDRTMASHILVHLGVWECRFCGGTFTKVCQVIHHLTNTCLPMMKRGSHSIHVIRRLTIPVEPHLTDKLLSRLKDSSMPDIKVAFQYCDILPTQYYDIVRDFTHLAVLPDRHIYLQPPHPYKLNSTERYRCPDCSMTSAFASKVLLHGIATHGVRQVDGLLKSDRGYFAVLHHATSRSLRVDCTDVVPAVSGTGIELSRLVVQLPMDLHDCAPCLCNFEAPPTLPVQKTSHVNVVVYKKPIIHTAPGVKLPEVTSQGVNLPGVTSSGVDLPGVTSSGVKTPLDEVKSEKLAIAVISTSGSDKVHSTDNSTVSSSDVTSSSTTHSNSTVVVTSSARISSTVTSAVTSAVRSEAVDEVESVTKVQPASPDNNIPVTDRIPSPPVDKEENIDSYSDDSDNAMVVKSEPSDSEDFPSNECVESTAYGETSSSKQKNIKFNQPGPSSATELNLKADLAQIPMPYIVRQCPMTLLAVDKYFTSSSVNETMSCKYCHFQIVWNSVSKLRLHRHCIQHLGHSIFRCGACDHETFAILPMLEHFLLSHQGNVRSMTKYEPVPANPFSVVQETAALKSPDDEDTQIRYVCRKCWVGSPYLLWMKYHINDKHPKSRLIVKVEETRSKVTRSKVTGAKVTGSEVKSSFVHLCDGIVCHFSTRKPILLSSHLDQCLVPKVKVTETEGEGELSDGEDFDEEADSLDEPLSTSRPPSPSSWLTSDEEASFHCHQCHLKYRKASDIFDHIRTRHQNDACTFEWTPVKDSGRHVTVFFCRDWDCQFITYDRNDMAQHYRDDSLHSKLSGVELELRRLDYFLSVPKESEASARVETNDFMLPLPGEMTGPGVRFRPTHTVRCIYCAKQFRGGLFALEMANHLRETHSLLPPIAFQPSITRSRYVLYCNKLNCPFSVAYPCEDSNQMYSHHVRQCDCPSNYAPALPHRYAQFWVSNVHLLLKKIGAWPVKTRDWFGYFYCPSARWLFCGICYQFPVKRTALPLTAPNRSQFEQYFLHWKTRHPDDDFKLLCPFEFLKRPEKKFEYACRICGQLFIQKTTLAIHQRLHVMVQSEETVDSNYLNANLPWFPEVLIKGFEKGEVVPLEVFEAGGECIHQLDTITETETGKGGVDKSAVHTAPGTGT